MDDNLIVLAKAGDEDAFEELYKKTWREVSPILKSRFFESICMDDIEDVLLVVSLKWT